ncbi:tRNA lysidine(34) synthetase TilS [Collinsella sp. AGMB00827]|uniref:tRNA(Ile)-lysidine synthase n=1 Tax=Collinsella ureilytica TaxID=2869515 RepID=A0ABS7MKD3_9ACTN|nr:tRNA lysidine(34) synthetase TilS [Collinsella urealyticum]MBY4797834.1 tRNA lysidine(34) synthetase TilS [Collinsella urealyticum]
MPTVAQHYKQLREPLTGPAPAADEKLNAPVLLMVSGGADSTALALLACTSRLDIDDGRGVATIARERLHVLHINHHLRGEASNRDEGFVRSLCARLGLPLCVHHASFQHIGSENLEAVAREVRYAAARSLASDLSQAAGTPISAARIVTAHTSSDRAETFFLNAIKGSGSSGLSSIPRRRGIIVRPLLDRTHDELVSYLSMRGESWCEDETNTDTTYARSFIRHKVLPQARELNASVERAIGTACDILSDEDRLLSRLAGQALRSCVRRRRPGLLALDGTRLASSELAIARRIVRLAAREIDPEIRLHVQHIEAVLVCVGTGSGSTTLPGGVDVRMEFGILTLRSADAQEEIAAGWIQVPGTMALANGYVLEAALTSVPAGTNPVAYARTYARDHASSTLVEIEALGFDPRALAAGDTQARLWVDGPEPGDVMCPLGMAGRKKKISDLLGSKKIPVAERPAVPVIRTAPSGAVVWVAGVMLDDRFKATVHTHLFLSLTVRHPGQ